MNRTDPPNAFINYEVRRFAIHLLYLFVVLILVSLILVCYIYIKQMSQVAHTVAKGNHNSVIIGEYRDLKTNLSQLLNQGFYEVQLLDINESTIISIRNDNAPMNSIFKFKLVHSIPVINNSYKNSKILFYYSILPPLKTTLAFWLFLLVLLLPILFTLNKRLVIFYRNKYKEKILIELGDLSRRVAHDLRSPLTGLEVISKNLNFNDEKEKTIFKECVKSINQIAADILLRHRDALTQSLHKKNKSLSYYFKNQNTKTHCFKPYQCINEVCLLKEVEYQKKGIRLIYNSTQEALMCLVYGSPIEFKRILSNLINNSYEAIINNQGLISINLDKDDRYLLIEIRDTGIGMPPELIDKILNAESSTGKANGNGIGLYSAKNMIEVWRGHLKIFSDFGKGTTIRITLPIASEKEVI